MQVFIIVLVSYLSRIITRWFWTTAGGLWSSHQRIPQLRFHCTKFLTSTKGKNSPEEGKSSRRWPGGGKTETRSDRKPSNSLELGWSRQARQQEISPGIRQRGKLDMLDCANQKPCWYTKLAEGGGQSTRIRTRTLLTMQIPMSWTCRRKEEGRALVSVRATV